MMKYIIALVFLLPLMAFAGPTYVTLGTGQVITVPEGGKTCTFEPTYCFMGYKPDGTFPGIGFRDALIVHVNAGKAAAYIKCEDVAEVDFSPSPICMVLMTHETYEEL